MLDRHMELMWAGALGAIPIAVIVGVVCRLFVRRPATRHAMWVMVLAAMFMPAAWWGASEGLSALEPHAQRAVEAIRSMQEHGSGAAVTDARPWLAGVEPARASADRVDDIPLVTRADEVWPGAWPTVETVEPAAYSGELLPVVDSVWSAPLPPFREVVSADEGALADGRGHGGAEVLPASGLLDRASAWARVWADWGGGVRDAAMSAPRVPVWVWVCGAGVVVLTVAVRILGLVRLIRGGQAVTERDARMVAELCELLGVRRVPRMVVVDRVVTPMVCLGRRATIVVPRALWFGMGADARRAILTHELAHLRRRDHWVCWAQLVVSCVYWWHPVSWWAGRRVREEADMACDAWVVSTMPRTRRVYAESLLRVRTFLTSSPPLTQAPALGMASSGVARFSRRITMVMTTNKSPRLSVFGSAAALAAASIGALIAPALACPPECEDAEAPAAVYFEYADPETPAPPGLSTFERFMGGGQDERAGALMEQFREMEARMRALEAMIQEYAARGDARAPSGRGLGGAAVVGGVPMRGFAETAPSDDAGITIFGSPAVIADGQEFERDYHMPGGKLEQVTELMSRGDVPTLIRPGDGYITVIGTAQEHAVFAAFVKMICPEGVKVTDDNGNPVQWRTAPAAPSAPSLLRLQQDAERARAAGGEHERAALEQLMAQRATLRAQQRTLTQQQRQLERQAAQAERKLEQSLDAIDGVRGDSARMNELERQAAEYRSALEALEWQVDAVDGDGDSLEEAIDSLEEQIDTLRELIKERAEAGSVGAGTTTFGSTTAVGFGR
ncbi:MAG: M56 family metallopeptidase [Phycisphaerales bacterium]